MHHPKSPSIGRCNFADVKSGSLFEREKQANSFPPHPRSVAGISMVYTQKELVGFWILVLVDCRNSGKRALQSSFLARIVIELGTETELAQFTPEMGMTHVTQRTILIYTQKDLGLVDCSILGKRTLLAGSTTTDDSHIQWKRQLGQSFHKFHNSHLPNV